MKTNFEYLKIQRKNINDNYDSDIHRFLRDLEFLLIDVEKKIYLREFMKATYPLRMVWDLSRDFIVHMIKNSENPMFNKWNDNLKNIRKKYDKYYVPGYLTIWGLHPNIVSGYIQGAGTYSEINEIFKEMNSWMHYRYDRNHKSENNAENINDNSTLFSHRSMVRYSQPTILQTVNYLETIWYVIVSVMVESGMFDEFDDYQFDFDREIYNNPEFAINKLLQYKEIDSLVSLRKPCPLCGEYSFKKPEINQLKTNMPYGAFIECSNAECQAKVDSTLKVKKNNSDKDEECTKCKSTNSIQLRYSLIDSDSGIYSACNKCSWNDKNEEVNEKDIMDEIEEYSFENSDYMDW